MFRTQQTIFTSEALPELFHSAPQAFLRFLERDGNKFLRFYWDEAGKNLPGGENSPSFGLNYDIHKPTANITLALITLPKPAYQGEAYFAAAIFRPLRRTPILGLVSDTSKYITLELAGTEGESPSTLMVEWTRKLQREVIGSGSQPVRDNFYHAVLELLND